MCSDGTARATPCNEHSSITYPHVPGCYNTLRTHLSFNFCPQQKEEVVVSGVGRKCDQDVTLNVRPRWASDQHEALASLHCRARVAASCSNVRGPCLWPPVEAWVGKGGKWGEAEGCCNFHCFTAASQVFGAALHYILLNSWWINTLHVGLKFCYCVSG